MTEAWTSPPLSSICCHHEWEWCTGTAVLLANSAREAELFAGTCRLGLLGLYSKAHLQDFRSPRKRCSNRDFHQTCSWLTCWNVPWWGVSRLPIEHKIEFARKGQNDPLLNYLKETQTHLRPAGGVNRSDSDLVETAELWAKKHFAE